MLSSSCVDSLKDHKYDILGFLGRGGFGSCWIVRSAQYKMDFVCKIISKRDVSKSFDMSFKREVEALVKFDHPNILKVYDVFSTDSEMFIILEYCACGSLEDLIKSGRKITPKQLYQYTHEIADALLYMHSNGYAHCDIKPSNILIDANNRIKLADFGLTVYCNENTKKRSYCGSLGYMAPELLVGNGYSPFKADVWAFGITLFYLCAGKIPFNGDNLSDILRDIECGYEFPSDTPAQIQDIVDKCLVFDPNGRMTISQIRQLISDYAPAFCTLRSKSVGKCLIHSATRTILEKSGRCHRFSHSSVY